MEDHMLNFFLTLHETGIQVCTMPDKKESDILLMQETMSLRK